MCQHDSPSSPCVDRPPHLGSQPGRCRCEAEVPHCSPKSRAETRACGPFQPRQELRFEFSPKAGVSLIHRRKQDLPPSRAQAPLLLWDRVATGRGPAGGRALPLPE